jgi:hypothetical protein
VRWSTGILIPLSSVVFLTSSSEASEWTLSARGGYGWSMFEAPPANGFYLGGTATRSLGTSNALVGSLGYLGWPAHPAPSICPVLPVPGPINCPPQISSSVVVPVGLGLRLGGEGSGGSLLPYLEMAPTVFYGRWTGESSSTLTKLFAGFQVAMGVPIRLSQLWHVDLGFLYFHSEAVTGTEAGLGEIQGLRSFHLYGSLVYHLRSKGS